MQIITEPLTTLEDIIRAQLVTGLTEFEDEQRFINPDPIEWIKEHFRIPETDDHRFPMPPYQEMALREALSRDADGNFKYSLIVWSDIKKSAKSTLWGAVALWRAFQIEWGSIKIVANDLKQADSRVSYYARRGIELNPEMHALCKIKPSGYTIDFPTRTRIEAIPVDPKGEAGGNDDMVVFSELWAAKDAAAQRLWTELTLSPTKYGQSFRVVETYAGFSGESPLLENLYEQGTKPDNGSQRFEWAEQFDPPLEIYHNDTARMFCLWNTHPRQPWQTHEYYAQEAGVLATSEFDRVHRNQWASSSEKYIPIEWWDACAVDDVPVLDEDDSLILAADAAVESDSFGLVAISVWPDTDPPIYILRSAMEWRPDELGGQVLFLTEEEDGPEDEIRRWIENKNVIEFAYDPYQLADMSQRLASEMIVHLHKFPQQGPRAISDKALFDKIRDRRVVYQRGLFPNMRAHLSNANRKVEGENKMRIIKRSTLLKIDLAVALSMGVERTEYFHR
jgi:phage terminase large subunit-like protein